MENNNTRRNFLSNTIKGGLAIAAGTTFLGAINPLSALAAPQSTAQLARVGNLGATSLQTSQLALDRAVNAQVKMYAKFEVAEQLALSQVLKDMGVTPAPDTAGKAIIDSLGKVTGAEFDKAFMTAQVDTHKKLFTAVSAAAASGNTRIKHAAGPILATIQEHTERGQMLLSQL